MHLKALPGNTFNTKSTEFSAAGTEFSIAVAGGEKSIVITT
jgi:hypothetical protein